jgi:hypothetical protein
VDVSSHISGEESANLPISGSACEAFARPPVFSPKDATKPIIRFFTLLSRTIPIQRASIHYYQSLLTVRVAKYRRGPQFFIQIG